MSEAVRFLSHLKGMVNRRSAADQRETLGFMSNCSLI